MSKKCKYYLDTSMTIRKAIVMYKIDDNVHSPVRYLKKPKWISDEEFKLLYSMEILIKKE